MSLKNTLSWLLLLLFTAMNASALDIPQGTFYFDNSLTRYTTVKFVYGSYSNPESYVITMTHEGNDLWSITIPERVTGMYRYTFAETSLSDGELYTVLTNKDAHGRKGALAAIVAGTKAEVVREALDHIPQEKSLRTYKARDWMPCRTCRNNPERLHWDQPGTYRDTTVQRSCLR